MIDPPPHRLTPVFAYIDAHRQSFLDQLLDYLRMPSISAHGVGMASVAAFLLERLGTLGMQARAIPTAGWPMIYGRRDDAPGKPTVLAHHIRHQQRVALGADDFDEWLDCLSRSCFRDLDRLR
jgi:hypothetical protein